MKKIKKLSLCDALTQGVIASVYRDEVNNQFVCYTELGSFFGAYSFGHFAKVFNSLPPIPLKFLTKNLADD